MSLESELESKSMSLESELESELLNLQNTGIGRNWNRNHMMLESESESESKFLGNTGIGIRIGINCYWNRNWNRNHGFWKTLESESESESTQVESELEAESLVPESFTTLVYAHADMESHIQLRVHRMCPSLQRSSSQGK